jgi:hypothetical protein
MNWRVMSRHQARGGAPAALTRSESGMQDGRVKEQGSTAQERRLLDE